MTFLTTCFRVFLHLGKYIHQSQMKPFWERAFIIQVNTNLYYVEDLYIGEFTSQEPNNGHQSTDMVKIEITPCEHNLIALTSERLIVLGAIDTFQACPSTDRVHVAIYWTMRIPMVCTNKLNQLKQHTFRRPQDCNGSQIYKTSRKHSGTKCVSGDCALNSNSKCLRVSSLVGR